MIPLTDALQTLHFLFYLDSWSHPALTHFMLGFKVAALRIGIIPIGLTLWDCPAKLQLIYGGCSLYSEFILPFVMLGIFITLNVILSKM